MKVLVPLLLRPNGPEVWIKNAEKIKNKLTYEDKDVVIFDEEVSSYQSKFAAEANARNAVIDKHLKDEHTHVFWIDTDVVEFHENIIEMLSTIPGANPLKDIVAPFVFLEDNDAWPFKRFYDISCFIDSNGENYDYKEPYNMWEKEQPLHRCKCVGTCFLMPASIYKMGVRYDPYDERNEHIPFFEEAKERGFGIWSTPLVEIRHAFLPKYGINFR